jgi:alkyl hydroperoxide reductase subunit AhpC
LHENLKELEGLDVEMFIISKDTPEHQLELHNALKEMFGYSLNLVSDPELELVDHFGMKDGDTAFRGYGLMDQEGRVILKTASDHWGEQITETVKEIKEEYNKLNEKN